MNSLLASSWFVSLVGSLAYLATTLFCFTATKFERVAVEQETANTAADMLRESWNFKNPEFDQMLEELRQERAAIATRETQLKELELRLATERHEIDSVTQAVLRLQHALEDAILRIRRDEVPNLKKIARVHASMSPDGSVNLLKQQTDDDIVKILFYLKPDEIGPILEAFGRGNKGDPLRASRLAERLRRTVEETAAKAKS